MSTSCTFGFYKNGVVKVDYNNSDSYPSGFGKLFVAFIRENKTEELHELFDKLKVVPRIEIPSREEKERLKKLGILVDFVKKGDLEEETWELISLYNESFMEYYKNEAYFIPDFSSWMFGQDWCYLINLDDNTFEVYSTLHDTSKTVTGKTNRYEGKLSFKANYSLDDIPKDWYKRVV